MDTEITVICENCKKEWVKSKLERYCSNCFCCTGCERYICPNCDEVIVIVPIKVMK